MPVVDDLYLQDQSVLLLKTEGQTEANAIFGPFIDAIEQSVAACAAETALDLKTDESKLLLGNDFCGIEVDQAIDEANPTQRGTSEVILFVDNREKRN